MDDNRDTYPNPNTGPRQLFCHDLKHFIETRTNEGYQHIVNGDLNS